MSRIKLVVTCAALLLCTSVLFAQEGRQRGGRGFGGGFGGQSALQLSAIEAVQKELNVSADQAAKLKTLGEEYRTEMRTAFTGGGNPREQTEEQRREQRTKMAENMAKLNEKFAPKLNEILDAAQKERLQQIRWQAAGASALQDEELVKALNLSQEQKDKLASVRKEYDDKQRELGAAGGQGPERFAKMGELRTARDQALNAVLSAEQQTALTKLKGKEFDLASLRGGQGGGRRRPNNN